MLVSSDLPIGFLDSGLGGLTVLQEARKLLPHENFLYLADTEALPYGDKPPHAIISRVKQAAYFLLEQKIKMLVLPCFTAASHAFEELVASFPIPIISIIPSGIDALLSCTTTNHVALLATKATIDSHVLQTKLIYRNPSLCITPIACPLFVPFIEAGLPNHPLLLDAARQYLLPLQHTTVDAILLGCTHYPLIYEIIEHHLHPHTVIDPACMCASNIQNTLSSLQLLNTNTQPGSLSFHATKNQTRFLELARSYRAQLDALFLSLSNLTIRPLAQDVLY